MSERERWIVYPLLFFALGAALRDKLTQTIESKDIVCQSLKIVDKHDSSLVLAELGIPRNGMQGRDVPITLLRADNIICESMSVLDQETPDKALIYLGTGEVPSYQPGEGPSRVGAVILKDSDGNQITELRADQILGNRLIATQVNVTDPVNRQPLVRVGTVPLPALAVDEPDQPVSYQGVIILNNQALGLQRIRTRVPQSPSP